MVHAVVIEYGGAGVWKEVKPDCVELTVRLGGVRLNCEPSEHNVHNSYGGDECGSRSGVCVEGL
jgi:hypothetical protein